MKTLISTSIAFLFSAAAVLGAPAKVGQTLPKLAELLPGATVPKTAGKVIIVDFWASWCAPCKASFPAFNRLQDKYSGKGLVILGVGVDDDAANYKEFSGKMGARFGLVHDSQKKVAGAFGPPAMPTSYIVDRKGVIRYVHTGFRGAKTEAEYVTEIEALLAEK